MLKPLKFQEEVDTGRGRYGKSYIISESELERFETYRNMKKEGITVKLDNDGGIVTDILEEVPMTVDEIKNRLPEDLKDRFKDIEEIKHNQGIMRDNLNDQTHYILDHLEEIKTVIRNHDELLIDSIKGLSEGYSDVKALYDKIYSEVYSEAFKLGYEKGYENGLWVKKYRAERRDYNYETKD